MTFPAFLNKCRRTGFEFLKLFGFLLEQRRLARMQPVLVKTQDRRPRR